jgi:hypothetical protein
VTRVCIVKRVCSMKLYDKKRKSGPSIVAARGLEAWVSTHAAIYIPSRVHVYR